MNLGTNLHHKCICDSIHASQWIARPSTSYRGLGYGGQGRRTLLCRSGVSYPKDEDRTPQSSRSVENEKKIPVKFRLVREGKHHATDELLFSKIGKSSHVGQDDIAVAEDAEGSQSLPILPKIQSLKLSKKKNAEEDLRTEVTQQHFGGALTTLVFGAALLSERLNGVGIVQNLELHNKGFHPVLLFAILFLIVASAWPEKRESRQPTLLVRIQMAGARFAYLGLASAIAAEMFTGKGVLSLLDVETGIEAFSDVEAVLVFLTMLVLTGPQSRQIR
eukprot:jgi/Picre1/35635/NNA_003096.t1